MKIIYRIMNLISHIPSMIKRKDIFIISIFLLAIISSGGAESPKLTLIREKKIFLKHNLDNVIFDKTGDKKNHYPKAIIDREGVIIFNDNLEKGKIIRGNVSFSEEKNYLAVKNTRHYMGGDPDDNLKIYDLSGKILWSLSDIPWGNYILSPNGQYVVVGGPGTHIPILPPAFINKDGIMNPTVHRIEFGKDPSRWIENAYLTNYAFTQDSSVFAAGLNKGPRNPGAIVFFNNGGQFILKKETRFPSYEMKFSPDGKSLIYCQFSQKKKISTLNLISLNGTHIWTKEIPSQGYDLYFNNSSNSILTVGKKNKIMSINPLNGNLNWEFDYNENESMVFYNSHLSDRYIFINFELKNKGDEKIILILNHAGQLVHKKELNLPKYTKIKYHGNSVFILNKDSFKELGFK